jgi:amino-acid N-acetyltransferase
MMPYERFRAWQACDELVLAIYRITSRFPSHERYGLVSQARRAAVSSAANIAEGSAKRGAGEFRRYLDIAMGSLAELTYLMRLSQRLQYVTAEQGQEIELLRSTASRLTWRLYEAISRRRSTPISRPPDRLTARPPDRPTARPPDRPMSFSIEPAKPTDLAAILDLLASHRLPEDEVERHLATALVAREGGRIAGCAVLEPYGTAGLLRSVAVAQSQRGLGVGIRLTEAAVALARAQGIKALYLLTETAAGFFPRFGFRPVSRDEVAPAVRASIEFTSACPASALAMVKDL